MKKPFLIVMSGAPGSGKSTLAQILAQELRVPYLERDIFFDSMQRTKTARGETFSRGEDGIPAFYKAIHGMLAHGVNLVVDGTLYAGTSEAAIEEFFETAQVINVHCRTQDPKRRFREREYARNKPAEWIEGFMTHLDSIASEVTDPLGLDWPIIEVETTGEYNPSVTDVVSHIKRLSSKLESDQA